MDTMGVHGMLAFGHEPMYMSHLPMFMSPHAFQVILQVSLSDEASGRLAPFRAHFGSDLMLTFKPDPFAITDLVDEPAPRRAFTGELFRGHFERGGDSIAIDVAVTVDRVVWFQPLAEDADKDPTLRYLAFGGGVDLYLTHLITAPPDFDQVLSAWTRGPSLTLDQLTSGVIIDFPDQPNSPEDPLRPDQRLFARLSGHNDETMAVLIDHEIYLETGDLATAMF